MGRINGGLRNQVLDWIMDLKISVGVQAGSTE
jgi:hypothetical protein